MTAIILLFILGTIIGSFLNVCIYRIPLKRSLWKPASFCPSCKEPISVWENVPVISFLLLKGKCAHCRKPISVQYVVVEVLTGLITVLAYQYFDFSNLFIIYSVFAYFLIVIGFIDFRTHLIHNNVLIALVLFAFAAQILSPFITWQNALTGMVVGGGSMFLISLLGRALFKKESLGMGDVKLAAVAGFFLGWLNILVAVYAGFVFAFITIILINSIKRTKITGHIPLGPFMALAIVVFLFWGKPIMQFYLSLLT